MFEIDAIETEGGHLFRQPTLYKLQRGLNVVTGLNKNRNNGGATNFSGKSLLLSPLSTVLIGTSPVPGTSAKARVKDLFGKGVTTGVHVRKNGTKYRIERKTTKTQIYENGDSLELRAEATTALRDKIVACTEEELFALHYINANRQSPLQFGSSAARFQFFSNLFGLDEIDVVRQKAVKELATASDALDDLKELKRELRKLCKQETEKPDVDSLRKDAKRARNALSTYEKAQAAYESVRELSKKAERIRAKWSTDKHPLDLKVLANGKRELEEDIRTNEQQVRLWREYSKLRKPEEPGMLLDEAKRQQRKCLRVPRAKQVPKARWSKTHDRELQDLVAKFEVVSSELGYAERVLTHLKHTLHDHKGENCPTCSQHLNRKQARRLLKDATKERDNAEHKRDKTYKQIHKLKQQRDSAKAYNAWREYRDVKANLDVAETAIAAHRDLREYRERRDELAREWKAKWGKAPRATDDRNETLRKRLRIVTEKLEDARFLKRVPESVERPTGDASKLRKRVRKCNKALERAVRKSEQYATHRQAIKTVQRKIDACDIDSERIEDLRVLVAALDNKNPDSLRQRACAALGDRIESRMNKHSAKVFNDTRKFQVIVTNNAFSILYSTDGGKTWPDVRNLSGAESRLWSVLNVLVLTPMLPAEHQWDTIVLDEADSCLDAPSIQALTHYLVPRLCKMRRKVVVITPNPPAEFLEGARAAHIPSRTTCVVRTGNQSVLEEL